MALLAVLIYFIRSWIASQKDKKDIAATVELGKTGEISNKAIETVISKIPKKDLQKVKTALDNFDVKPIADIIYKANGTVNDDENSVYAAFGMLNNKAELAMLTLYFQMLYKINLFVFLQNFLDASELAIVNNIIKDLPEY